MRTALLHSPGATEAHEPEVNMNEWRVDADGVLGVLAGLDDQREEFESAHRKLEEAAFERSASLTVDGRTTVSAAWDRFMEERRLMPGRLMHSVASAAQAVGEATAAVIAGDEEMAHDTVAALQAGTLA
jgi:hypothetical protein